MKKFFTLIALFAISTCAVMAQNQILNGGFEDWGRDAGNTPDQESGETVLRPDGQLWPHTGTHPAKSHRYQ